MRTHAEQGEGGAAYSGGAWARRQEIEMLPQSTSALPLNN
jgi:hypothetical protein